jgi:hypothetical protein
MILERNMHEYYACAWCGRTEKGGPEEAKRHAKECPKNPVADELRQARWAAGLIGQCASEALGNWQDLEHLRGELQDEIAALRELVQHCSIHSGFMDCGSSQMDSQMRSLFNRVLGREEDCSFSSQVLVDREWSTVTLCQE